MPLLILYRVILLSQSHHLANNVPLIHQQDTLHNAWAGGFNSPQFSAIDLNLDSIADMVVYDREDHTFTPYINRGCPGKVSYHYAPQYKKAFKDCECDNWALLVDYNCDGRADVFCSNNSYIDIYEQVVMNQEIRFVKRYSQVESDYGPAGSLWMSSPKTDLPAVIDIDDDGDVDIFYRRSGFTSLDFHRNIAMDSLGRCDTLMYELSTDCWGHYHTNILSNTAELHDTLFCSIKANLSMCKGVGRSKTGGGDDLTRSKHGGSSVLLLDLDGDRVKDALMGDVSFKSIFAVHNCGLLDYAYMDSADNTYPSYDTPIDLDIFPSCYFVDVNNDSARDLLIAPFTSDGENKYNDVYYMNKGPDDFPDFEYQGPGVLQGEMTDYGRGSVPVFFDYNADSLPDLLVGNSGAYDSQTQSYAYGLSLYKNTGNAHRASFTLVDDDYLGLRNHADSNYANLSPAFGDLDGDGDQDMLLGVENGSLYYYENQAGAGQPVRLVHKHTRYLGITTGSNSAPLLYDLDGDGDLDLFSGSGTGRMFYYKNIGTATQPTYSPISTDWGFLRFKDRWGNISLTANLHPLIMDRDGDGKPELLAGSISDHILIYDRLDSAETYPMVLRGNLYDARVGTFSAVAAAVLDSSGQYSYVIGNERGGLQIINTLPEDSIHFCKRKTTSISSRPQQLPFRLYPNPAKDEVQVDVGPALFMYAPLVLSLYDALGRHLLEASVRSHQHRLSLKGLSPGMYLVRLSGKHGYETHRLILQR